MNRPIASPMPAARCGRQGNLDVARADLSTRLAAAYRAGTIDPIVILLSASSLSDALDGIEIVNRVSQRDAMLIANVEHGLAASQRAERLLQSEQRRLDAATAAAEAEQRASRSPAARRHHWSRTCAPRSRSRRSA